MRRNKPTLSNQNPSVLTEKDFFASVTIEDLYFILQDLQEQKRKYFKTYLSYLEYIAEATSIEVIEKLSNEKGRFWEKQLHIESLIQWCFKEISKRNFQ